MTHVEELLSVWRDAERLLDTLSPLSPDHETVRLQVVRLRAAYQIMTDRRPATEQAVALSQQTLRDASALLTRVRMKGADLPSGQGDPSAEPA